MLARVSDNRLEEVGEVECLRQAGFEFRRVWCTEERDRYMEVLSGEVTRVRSSAEDGWDYEQYMSEESASEPSELSR